MTMVGKSESGFEFKSGFDLKMFKDVDLEGWKTIAMAECVKV